MSKLKAINISEEQARELLARAEAAKANTYPDSGGYACALLTDSGNIYDGAAYKSTTLTLTMHCESTALANAAIHGDKNVIAITGPNCHICKQIIWESALQSGNDIVVVMEENGDVKQVPISEQMAYPWPDADGNL